MARDFISVNMFTYATGVLICNMSTKLQRADIDRAIEYAEFNRGTHITWACHYNRHPEDGIAFARTAGDRAHQLQCIAEYNLIISVLRAARELVA